MHYYRYSDPTATHLHTKFESFAQQVLAHEALEDQELHYVLSDVGLPSDFEADQVRTHAYW